MRVTLHVRVRQAVDGGKCGETRVKNLKPWHHSQQWHLCIVLCIAAQSASAQRLLLQVPLILQLAGAIPHPCHPLFPLSPLLTQLAAVIAVSCSVALMSVLKHRYLPPVPCSYGRSEAASGSCKPSSARAHLSFASLPHKVQHWPPILMPDFGRVCSPAAACA